MPVIYKIITIMMYALLLYTASVLVDKMANANPTCGVPPIPDPGCQYVCICDDSGCYYVQACGRASL